MGLATNVKVRVIVLLICVDLIVVILDLVFTKNLGHNILPANIFSHCFVVAALATHSVVVLACLYEGTMGQAVAVPIYG